MGKLAYPERLAYQLLQDLSVAATEAESHQQSQSFDGRGDDALNAALQPRMRQLIAHYEDEKNHRIRVLDVDVSSDSNVTDESRDAMMNPAVLAAAQRARSR